MGAVVDSAFLQAPKRVASSFPPLSDLALAAISANDAVTFHSLLSQQRLDIDSFYVWTDPKTNLVCFRSLCMIAAFYAATDVLAILLGLGADAAQHSPDDMSTALHCACSNPNSSNTCLAIKMLMSAGARLDVLDKHNRTARDLLSLDTAEASSNEDDTQNDCFKSDDFRMFSFKVEVCQRLDEQHDWTTCPFMHPGEKARRRDPRSFKYDGVPCPDFRKGSCKRGDGCTYAHGVFECWLHPARYRTQLCKEGALCKRGVCFFAHSVEELREPLHLHGDKADGLPRSPKGPLTPGEASSQDTSSSRSSSPDPVTSRDGSATSTLRAPSGGAHGCVRAFSRRDSFGSSATSKLRTSTESMRGVLERAQSMASSAESSLSSTPVLDGPLAASVSTAELARSLSGLSLVHEDAVAAAAAAAAAATVAAFGMSGAQQLGGASSPLGMSAAAANWGLCGAMQMHPNDLLAYQMAAAGLQLPLGSPILRSMLPNQAAAMQMAALQQHSLGFTQAPLDSAAALLAAAGLRQPLQALSLNVDHNLYQPVSMPYPACLGL